MDWLTCYSSERYGVPEATKGPRTEYERDYDRLIFSSAFRRLQNKTQVFPLPHHVFVHNRLTHSLEVASVGRSLGKIVGKELHVLPAIDGNADAKAFYRNHLKNVIASACLAHDLGNPAFGHSGEEAISKYFIDKESDASFTSSFSSHEWVDLVKFEGNANALRILTKKFNHRLQGGFQLTYSTLASIIKYPCESMATDAGLKHRSKYGFFQEEKPVFLEIASKVGLIMESSSPLAYYRHPFVYLVEAADDICYNIIDLEDAHRLKILSTKQIEEYLMELIRLNGHEDMNSVTTTKDALSNDANEKIAYLRAKAINYLTLRAAQVFIDNKDKLIKGIYDKSLIESISEAQATLTEIEDISYKNIYNHDSVVRIELAGFRIMSGLIEDFVEAALIEPNSRKKRHKKVLSLLPEQYKFVESQSSYSKVMSILDFMSGMTDLYALQLYRNLRGIEIPEI